jgi:hypothetical protein
MFAPTYTLNRLYPRLTILLSSVNMLARQVATTFLMFCCMWSYDVPFHSDQWILLGLDAWNNG